MFGKGNIGLLPELATGRHGLECTSNKGVQPLHAIRRVLAVNGNGGDQLLPDVATRFAISVSRLGRTRQYVLFFKGKPTSGHDRGNFAFPLGLAVGPFQRTENRPQTGYHSGSSILRQCFTAIVATGQPVSLA